MFRRPRILEGGATKCCTLQEMRGLRTLRGERAPAFSPDGEWLAYVSSESGRNEIYVQPYPGTRAEMADFDARGTDPAWSPGGTELF